MGCSPSKGKLFSKPDVQGLQKEFVTDVKPDPGDCGLAKVKDTCLKTEEPNEELTITDKHQIQALPTDATENENAEDVQKTQVDSTPRETAEDAAQTNAPKSTEKQKKNKSKRRCRLRKSSAVQRKVEFPTHMVKAHQAAYYFLNPNISKYETLLGLLDQAAQTQLSLQPMMSALVMRFEEVNQALEEMAEEGELMLKEHGSYLALPSGMKSQAPNLANGSDSAKAFDPCPDLLQELLHQSAEKMRQVGGSVQALGDTTLEEAADYFSSLSKVLLQKLLAKQGAERRLAQVLARVEGAATGKANPEDRALQSEDSGIGGENESLTGSEKHRRHRGSAGSVSCGSGVNVRGALDSTSDQVGHNEDEEEEEEDDDDDEDEDDENERPERKRSSSSPPDPSQALRYLYANSMQDFQSTVRRPLTAARPEQPPSTMSESVMAVLEKSPGDLYEKMKEISEMNGSPRPPKCLSRSGFRRHSLNAPFGRSPAKGQSGRLPPLGAHSQRRPCVRRLINTFSQGVDGRPGQSLANVPPHIRKPNKSRMHLLSDAVSASEGVLPASGSGWPDSKDDLDVDSLPPPPPEFLMDNSFQTTDGRLGHGESQHGPGVLPVINQKIGTNQRLKMRVQAVDVLPNKTIPKPKSGAVSAPKPGGQEVEDGEREETAESRGVPMRDVPKSPEPRYDESSPRQTGVDHRRQSDDQSESDSASSTVPVRAPPVSRVRLPPSGPSVRHRYPSPPVFRQPSTSRPSSRPGSPRAIVRASDRTPEEIVPSVSFRDARSVFCQKEQHSSQPSVLFGSSVLPRQWGEGSRGRLATRGAAADTPTPSRRTQSEQRPRW